MPPAKRSASRRSARRAAVKEPAALRRLNKSLDSAQAALGALRKDVGKDVSGGARDLYKDLDRFVKDARRGSGKLGTALQRDIARLQKQLASSSSSRRSTRSGGRKASGRSTAKRSTAKRSTAKRSTAKRSTAKRSTVKRSTAKRSTVKKTSARKSPAKRSGARKTTAKRAASRKR
jgi:DNA-binding protein HU-beta